MHTFMRRLLATDHGQQLYRQRQITIEPVFGQIKFNRAIKRFQRRGRTACRSDGSAAGRRRRRNSPPRPSTRPPAAFTRQPQAGATAMVAFLVRRGHQRDRG